MTTIDQLDSPQLLIDLDVLDANLERMRSTFAGRPLAIRIHFKSLKCGGLARYLSGKGMTKFLCAKLNEAEVLADAGVSDIFIANQVIGPDKLRRLCELAKRAQVRVCVDDAGNVEEMGRAARAAGVTVGVLVEVDVGMARCGVEPGTPALELARHVQRQEGLRFVGLQGYDGHLQLMSDTAEQRRGCLEALEKLVGTRRLLEANGIPVEVVTGAGTGTSAIVGRYDGVTEIQPGSFLLMDCAYHAVRPEFACSLSVLCTVISRRPGHYVLDAGSKAISQDFGKPMIKGRPEEKVQRLAEEHAKVEDGGTGPKVGERREVVPAHCCATMNLHRQCIAHRGGRVEAFWSIEASGRYD
ncbi:MAG: DSD1 family PLP-dependent enzyme [Planctomycetes bacterium]|nr:DSD1 family PLP-dependent enzyme [Planctomycetota bacterium]